jgi:F-type H+-transporting ATPase subunit b
MLMMLVLFLSVGTSAILPSPVVAAPEAAPGAAGEAGHKTGGEDTPFGWALDLFVWTMVVFLLLMAILGKFAWGPMLEGLKKREENIRAAIDEAQKARDEAQKMRVEMEQERTKLAEERARSVEENRKIGDRLKEEMKAEAQAQITAERDRLRREIQLATDQALQQIWHQAANLATEVSSKAIQRQLSPDDHRRLVDDALRDMKITNGKKA